MNETMMTVRGNVVDQPKLRRTKSGHAVANFRVASTQRRFDRELNAWVDAGTLFVAVTAWRALGENVHASLEKGQPVVVHGRYNQRDYVRDEQPRTAYELEALVVGHDLGRGTSAFQRVARTGAVELEVDGSGAPVDASDDFLDLADPADEVDIDGDVDGDIDPGLDPVSGEVREPAGV